ncbi:MAG: EAL domain-containing protein [Caldilineaceae bacterium]
MTSRIISFWFIWIVPFVFLICLAVGLVAFLSLRNGQKAVDELAEQLLDRTNQLVTQHLESYLAVPKRLIQLNAAALESGLLDWQDFATVGDYFWQQTKLYDVSWMNYGLERGEYAGAGYDDDIGMLIGELSPATKMQYVDFLTNEEGQRLAQTADPDYDYRQEAWYRDAIDAGKLTWSEIYLWEGTYDIISSTMAVAISQPLYRGNAQPIGAVGIDLSLTKISDFLRTVPISPSMRVVIVETDGMVVAMSGAEDPFVPVNDQLTRLHIAACKDPLIQAANEHLRQALGGFGRIHTTAALQFVWNHERQFVRVTPWQDELGLTWIVVMVVSESDFMGRIHANTYQTIWLSWGALLLAILTGFWTSRLITRRVATLNGAAQQIAAGQLDQQLASSGIRELDAVGHSFNSMTVQLRNSFTKLEYAATHDPLTGLPNRAAFQHCLTEALTHATRQISASSDSKIHRQLAVLFLDLDYFKVLNDSLGHLAGDQILKEVAQRLRSCIQTHGQVARFGGDEFLILIDSVGQRSEIEALVEQILHTIRQPFLLNDNPAVISTSIGIAFSSPETTDADSLLRNAGIALYRAKANGKAVYEIFDEEMHVEILERLQLETDLRAALLQKALMVYYQPIVDANTLEMVGMEALIRWCHPRLGMISPAKFIPIAEETGLIIPLGWWVLRTACQQVRQWQQQFPARSLVVNVNLSTRQFLHPDLIHQVSQILRETELPPQSLKLEITESLLIRDWENMQTRLQQLKALGVQLSLDDFGTGYSSLSYLHHFPLDTLKIDRSFVQQMLSDKQCQAVIESIVTLAHKLGMNVIAEGVETEEALYYLRDIASCEQIQGFLISAAVSPEEIRQRIAEQHVAPFYFENGCVPNWGR